MLFSMSWQNHAHYTYSPLSCRVKKKKSDVKLLSLVRKGFLARVSRIGFVLALWWKIWLARLFFYRVWVIVEAPLVSNVRFTFKQTNGELDLGKQCLFHEFTVYMTNVTTLSVTRSRNICQKYFSSPLATSKL